MRAHTTPSLGAICLGVQVIERREEFDFTRHAAFCAFGFAYLGGFQYWLYNIKFTQVGAALGAVRCAGGCTAACAGGGKGSVSKGAGGEADAPLNPLRRKQ